MSIDEKNMQLMKALDDAWNSQDWNTFEECHADDVSVFWPGQPEPTRVCIIIVRKLLNSRHFLTIIL
jgi:hypothetical protein